MLDFIYVDKMCEKKNNRNFTYVIYCIILSVCSCLLKCEYVKVDYPLTFKIVPM